MKRTLSEEKILKKLDIPDFRHLSKDKVVAFASLLPHMDPEVAKKALEQFPEFASTSMSILNEYKDIIQTSLESETESTAKCYEIYDKVMSSLEKMLDKDGLTFDEQMYILEQMREVASEVNAKDSEIKKHHLAVIGVMGSVAIGIAAFLGASLGTNFGAKSKDDEK